MTVNVRGSSLLNKCMPCLDTRVKASGNSNKPELNYWASSFQYVVVQLFRNYFADEFAGNVLQEILMLHV